MIDLEEFTTDYRSYVEKWFYKRIKTDDFKPSFDDFWSYVIQEFLRRDTLSKFKEDHFSNAQFTTWLFTVLERHFSDFRRKEKKYDWVGITPINQPEEKGVISERKLGFVDISILESPSELAYVIDIINHIPNDLHRVIVKLKFFYPGKIELTTNDFHYIEQRTDKSKNIVNEFIRENLKQDFGLRDNDITELLDMNKGSINTTFQRAVRKYLIEPYNRKKASS